MTHRSLTRFASLAAALAAATVLAACSSETDTSGDDASQSASDDASAATSEAPPGDAAAAPPEADLEGLPKVVAEVDGKKISREDFVEAYEAQLQQASAQSQQTGAEVDQDALKQETADNLVSNSLLAQAAEGAGISPKKAEVDATIEELAQSNGVASAKEFLTTLKEQGFTESEVRDEVENQLKIEQYITDEGDVKAPSEKEVRGLYDEIAGQEAPEGADAAEATLPPFKDVKPQLEQQLEQEAQSAAVQTLLKDLRSKADITINL